MRKPDEHFFFSDEQTRWVLFFQMSKPDEHLFSDEQTTWALFFHMSKPDEHYSSDEQAEMSTFLSDEQVKMSTLYFQMSTFYLWDEHLSTLCSYGPPRNYAQTLAPGTNKPKPNTRGLPLKP